ncbi:hypothetical protein psal_cds_407 [Pandoravirus salinus]|uniref:Uncharacterized protein n=1 Tax=Pandoravirus salinus TaxID=1349410 RepID=S4VXD4_9VIRU|nr:hypothetical protein psal_cds_407 [Pandoravirus salinus]AGO84116.1 hypothetical protein psal_cds_407 [Pandoravirus salinus]
MQSLLDDLPLSRVAAAFERPAVGVTRSLFALCLRAIVPFDAVDALVQRRLPGDADLVLCAPVRHGRAEPHPPMAASSNTSVADDKPTVGDTWKSRDVPSHALWWVSCCGCLRRLAADAAPRYDADAYWCGGPCARGWLRRVPTRDAMRIVAWHWASVVAARYTPLGEGDLAPCRGLYERDWFHVAGHEAAWDYMGPDMSEPDAVVFDVVFGDTLSSSMVPRSEVDAIRAAVDANDRVAHPTYSAVGVFLRHSLGAANVHATPSGDGSVDGGDCCSDSNRGGGGYGRDDGATRHPISVIALVDGDRQFAGEIAL